jgi:hypothetical protein
MKVEWDVVVHDGNASRSRMSRSRYDGSVLRYLFDKLHAAEERENRDDSYENLLQRCNSPKDMLLMLKLEKLTLNNFQVKLHCFIEEDPNKMEELRAKDGEFLSRILKGQKCIPMNISTYGWDKSPELGENQKLWKIEFNLQTDNFFILELEGKVDLYALGIVFFEMWYSWGTM